MERSEHDRAVRRLVIVTIVVICVMLLATWAAATVVFTRFLVMASPSPVHHEIDAEAVKQHFAEDYPGWTLEDSGVRTYTEDGHAISEYTMTAQPPGRDYTIGIAYEVLDNGSPRCLEDVLRPEAVYEERAEALYEVLEYEFVSVDKEMRHMETLHSGSVIVEWVRPSDSWLGLRDERGFELLYYTDYDETWLMAP